MGAGVDETGKARLCDGTDVCTKLDKVFSHPGQPKYQAAQREKQRFHDIWNGTGSSEALHAAYMAVNVEDSLGWKDYLATLEPDDIKRLALVRFEGLDRTKGMKTKTHDPKKGEG